MTCPTAFQSRSELRSVVDGCLKESPVGDCSTEKYGPIGEWNVSLVNGMKEMFERVEMFNGDISKWDVSKVYDMTSMFFATYAFNVDISKWNVSRVTDMR